MLVDWRLFHIRINHLATADGALNMCLLLINVLLWSLGASDVFVSSDNERWIRSVVFVEVFKRAICL